jgi:hypothetical protein
MHLFIYLFILDFEYVFLRLIAGLRVTGCWEMVGDVHCPLWRHLHQAIRDSGQSSLRSFGPVLGIQIRRIPMFLCLQDLDPDSLVKGTDPDQAPDPSVF